ncbi:hypothetical protein ACFL6I_22120 [candidate division KSB1 bacterium]
MKNPMESLAVDFLLFLSTILAGWLLIQLAAHSVLLSHLRAVYSSIARELYHIKRRAAFYLWIFEFFTAILPALIVVIYGQKIIFHIQFFLMALIGPILLVLFFKTMLKERFIAYREMTCDDLTIRTIQDPLLRIL